MTAELPVRWQAGYPQSGNTWLCFILAGLCGYFPPTWEEGKRMIPNWDAVALGEAGAPLGWVRCHIMFNEQFLGHVPEMGGVREAIYIIRHPMNIMLSAYRYEVQYHSLTLNIGRYIDRFLDHGGEPDNLQLGAGTWAENVTSWDRAGVARVRYEDLEEDAYNQIRRIANDKVDSSTIHNALKGASRDRMSALDTQRFVGTKHADWRDLMTKTQMVRARREFGDVAWANGYVI